MDLNKIFQSKVFQGVLIGIGIIIILAAIFKVGMFVGSRKANFSYRWGENYHRNFGGPRGGFMGGFSERDFTRANGTFGKIIKIELPIITVGGGKDAEKAVVLKENTVIELSHETILPKDLKIDDNVVVIGSPNDAGQIEAKLIRVMPPPPAMRPPFAPDFGMPPPMPFLAPATNPALPLSK